MWVKIPQNAGLAQWGVNLVTVLMGGPAELMDAFARQIATGLLGGTVAPAYITAEVDFCALHNEELSILLGLLLVLVETSGTSHLWPQPKPFCTNDISYVFLFRLFTRSHERPSLCPILMPAL